MLRRRGLRTRLDYGLPSRELEIADGLLQHRREKLHSQAVHADTVQRRRVRCQNIEMYVSKGELLDRVLVINPRQLRFLIGGRRAGWSCILVDGVDRDEIFVEQGDDFAIRERTRS